ncbi:Cysteine proteinase [Ilyonectria robusta]
MGKARELQYLVVVGATPASNDEVQSMIRGVAGKHDTEVCFAQSEESRRGANGDDRAHTGSLQTDSSINACKGAVIPWPKWTATGELQAACFGLAVQDSRKRNSAENGNKTGTDGHIEDIILPSKLWGETFEQFESKFEAIRIAPEAQSVTLFPVYLSLKEESAVLPKRSKDTGREAWSTKGATYMDPIKIGFDARSQGFITYRFCRGSKAERIILEVIHPLGYRRLEFVVSRERWRLVLELCKDDSPSSYDIQKSIFAIGFGNSRAFKVVWDQGVPQESQACWHNDKWKTWTLYRRPALPKGLRIGRGGVNWASAGFCPMINFKAPKLSRKDRLVFVMLPSEGNRSRPQLYVNVRGGELLKILETNINWEDAAPLPLDRSQDLKETFYGKSSRSASPVKETLSKDDENEVVSVSSDSGTPGTTSEEHDNLLYLLEQRSTESVSSRAEDRVHEDWVPPISGSISCLHAGKRLSDEIVNLYLECTLKKREDTLLLNSYFFTRLCEKNRNIGDQEIRKLGLFSKRYRFVVIPIFDKSREHWRIAVMCNTANAASVGTDRALSVRNATASQWSIVITMDSYFDEEMGVKQPLQGLLVQAGKIGSIAIEADNDLLEVRAQHLPKQDNDYDCGVYILGYMKLFFQDPDVAIRKILAYEELGWELNATTQRLAIQRAMNEAR